MNELELLFEDYHHDCKPWAFAGKIPKHIKRCSVSEKEQMRLAKLGGKMMMAAYNAKTFYCQSMIAGAILDPKYDEIVVVTPSQYGKAIEKNVPVLTKNGWKKHGDLAVGDEVLSLDGNWVKVIYVHPDCEMDRKVTLENGDSFICHHNHEWVVKGTKGRRKEKCLRSISVETMERRGTTLPDGHRKFVIPVSSPMQGEDKKLPVEPYVLGVWLGDGSTSKGQICAHPNDVAVLDKCREFYPNGTEWAHKDTGVITRSFTGLATDLHDYGLCNQTTTIEKYIPDDYLTASYDQRLRLLAGLIDTDGYSYNDEGKSRVYFTTAGEKLRDGVETLISTFGWRTSTVQIEPRESSSGIKGKRPYWVIGFNPDVEIPCVLERKIPNGKSKQKGVGIVSIEPIPGYMGNCITVEGGIYRIGKHLIPTHNSWLMGRVALFRSYQGNKQYVTGAVANVTGIIMGEVIRGTQEAHPQIKAALMVKGDELARLAASLSKQRLAFASGGFVEAITLGDAYENNLTTNKAVGRAGDYIVDEAALVSDKSFVEMGRREFARVDGSKYKMIMISNPHRPGIFYDKLTEENPPKSRFILWIDALTAVEEERFDINTVFESDFAKNKSTMRRYLLCVLDTDGGGMFDAPKVYENHYETEGAQYFLGVDAAYKGKDNITVSLNVVGDGKFHIDEIFTMDKGKHWIDGVTSEDIIRTIARMARMTSAACVCVDVGWGVWLVEGLIRHGVHAIGVNFSESPTKARISAKQYAATTAANKRAEMHLDLQCLMEDGILEMSEDVYDKVKGTLPYVTSERKANGKIQIVPKEKIKAIIGHSPDELDSILLSVHAAIRFFGTASYAIP